jgi:hypothetical protein
MSVEQSATTTIDKIGFIYRPLGLSLPAYRTQIQRQAIKSPPRWAQSAALPRRKLYAVIFLPSPKLWLALDINRLALREILSDRRAVSRVFVNRKPIRAARG